MLKKALFVAAMLFVAVIAIAQPVFPETPAAEGVDWSYLIGKALVPVTYAMVFGIRLLLPRLPRMVVWTLPMVLGAGLTALQTYLMTLPAGSVNYLAVGAAAIALNEAITTVKRHGVNG